MMNEMGGERVPLASTPLELSHYLCNFKEKFTSDSATVKKGQHLEGNSLLPFPHRWGTSAVCICVCSSTHTLSFFLSFLLLVGAPFTQGA